MSWARENGDQPLLALVGEGDSGKSYHISSAISHLRSHGSLQQPGNEKHARHLVAFHFLNNAKPNASIHSLGKSIIWQLAAGDASYKQSVAAICRDRHIDSKEIMSHLLLESRKELNNVNAVFYIVINKVGNRHCNVDESLVKFLQGVLRSQNRAVRVLFSTTPGTMKKLQAKGIKCPIIQIQQKSEGDIRKYIDARMDRIPVLSNSRHPKVAEVRAAIQQSLYEKTEGNYDLINATLEEIRSLENDREIYDILKGAGRSMEQHILDDVRKLNETRTVKELREINEVTLWLTYAKQRMSQELVTAVLHVKNQAASLRPLEDRLKEKLVLFEINEDGFVDFRNQEVRSILPQRDDITRDDQDDTKSVKKGEIDVVQHFLNNVCPPALLQKLDLDQYFQSRLENRQQEQVYQEDKNTGHFLIAQTCIGVLANNADAELTALRRYAAVYLMDHLVEIHQTRVEPKMKAAMGANLAKLFRHPGSIDNVLWAATSVPTLPRFLNAKGAAEILKWLRDPEIVKSISDEDAELWSTVDVSNQHKVLVEPYIHRLAFHCLCQESSQEATLAAFKVIVTFCEETGGDIDTKAQQQPQDIGRVEEWCRTRLQVEPDALWHTQMAMVFRGFNRLPEAMERCETALHHDTGS